MDAALIYAASESARLKVKWEFVSHDTEWVYFGAGNDTSRETALKYIDDFFTGSTVILAIDRRNSVAEQKENLHKTLDGLLGIKNFLIWDNKFRKVIEFSSLGVLRRGCI